MYGKAQIDINGIVYSVERQPCDMPGHDDKPYGVCHAGSIIVRAATLIDAISAAVLIGCGCDDIWPAGIKRSQHG